jgi:proline iminopeptidase
MVNDRFGSSRVIWAYQQKQYIRRKNMPQRLTFYPDIRPFDRGRLQVSQLHEIYYEQCGNPAGKPVVVLHGGPGGGISPMLRQMHDPRVYRMVLFDQRGCGNSTPHAELRENTTWDLVADIERLREKLGIARWQVVGGSWGSTLALAYAQRHRERVTELILRGIFTLRQKEVNWFYQFGASEIFPDAWQAFVAPIPEPERHDMVGAYHERLTGGDPAVQRSCARAWSQWEGSTLSLYPDPLRVARFGADGFALAFARIECHYFINKGFFETDGQLLADMHLLHGVPGVIVQGRYDVVTPPVTAFDLSRAWPKALLEWVPDAGHTATEPGIQDALVRATQGFGAV